MFSGKTVAITGAASGIGRALCFRFAKQGAVIAALDHNEIALNELSKELQKSGAEFTTYKVDVTDRSSLSSCLADILARGKLDVFVNNAGIAHSSSFGKMKPEQYRQELEVNLLGSIHGTHLALEKLEAQGFGTIVNMASVAGHIPAPFLSIYTASKFAIVGFTRALREELAQLNSPIKLVLVSPGFVKSDMTDRNKFPSWLSFMLATPENVAQDIVRAVAKNKLEIVPSLNGKMMKSMHFFAPKSTIRSSKVLLTKSFKDLLLRRFDQPE